MVVLVDILQLPEVVSVAFRMGAVRELEVGLPVVVLGYPLEVLENSDGLHGFVASLRVNLKNGGRFGPGPVQPLQFGLNAHSGFVEMHHRGLNDYLLDSRQSALCSSHGCSEWAS